MSHLHSVKTALLSSIFVLGLLTRAVDAASPAPSGSLPSTLIDDFNNSYLSGPNPARTNLWGGRWTVLDPDRSMSVTYNGPGYAGSKYSAGVTGTMKGTEWVFGHSQGPGADLNGPWSYAILQCPLYSIDTPVNVECHGLRGIQFWIKGDGGLYRVEVPSASVTNGDHWCWYGVNFTPPPGVWTFHQIPFSEMTRQKGAPKEGLPEHPDGSDITGIQIYPLKSGPFAFSLTQISFFGSYVPSCGSPVIPWLTSTSTFTPTYPIPSPTPVRLVPKPTASNPPKLAVPSPRWVLPTPTRFFLPTATLPIRPAPRPKPQPRATPTPARLNPAQWPPLDPSLNVVFTEPPANIYLTFADGPGRYQVEVVDDEGNSLEALFDRKVVAQSDSWVEWDGLDQKGKLVSPGQYFVILLKDGKALKRISVIRNKPLPK